MKFPVQSLPNTRPWQEIAAEAGNEMNSEKRQNLIEELERALDERDRALRGSLTKSA